MKKLLTILNIEFLSKDDKALKNWKMIFFLSFLALIMIASGHSADRKIFKIAKLNAEIKALKSEFVEYRSMVMEMKKETTVTKNLTATGVKQAKEPPIKIVVTKE